MLALFTGFNQINLRSSNLDKDCIISGRQRRKRAKYTKNQLLKLELEFERNPYPNSWERETLAQQLGIHETRIQVKTEGKSCQESGVTTLCWEVNSDWLISRSNKLSGLGYTSGLYPGF